MKLERLNPFNSADGHVGRTTPGIDASSVVKAGNRIFMSGQTGQPISGTLPDTTNPAELAEQAVESVSSLLGEAGATLADVCKVTTWLTDKAYRPAVYNMVNRSLSVEPTVGTGIVTKGLALPGMMCNLGIEAVIPGPEGHKRYREFDTAQWFDQNKLTRRS